MTERLVALDTLCMPGRRSYLPTLVSAGGTVVRKVRYTIFNPAGLRPVALLAKSRVDAGFALLDRLNEGILLAFRLCLTSGAAVVHTAHLDFVLIAEVVPIRFFAGHHLGQNVLLEHITVCQYI